MKKIIFGLFLILSACGKDGGQSATPAPDTKPQEIVVKSTTQCSHHDGPFIYGFKIVTNSDYSASGYAFVSYTDTSTSTTTRQTTAWDGKGNLSIAVDAFIYTFYNTGGGRMGVVDGNISYLFVDSDCTTWTP